MLRFKKTWSRATAGLCLSAFVLVPSLSAQTTIIGLDGMTKSPLSYPVAVSNGGTAVAGYEMGFATQGVDSYGWRWTPSGSTEDLGHVLDPAAAYYLTTASGISANGLVISGTCIVGFGSSGIGHAFRWTASGGMQDLGWGNGRGISADGSVVAGASGNNQFPGVGACLWASDGTPNLIGSPSLSAAACSHDGGVVVMQSDGTQLLIWDHGTVTDLALPAGWTTINAYAMSADGTAITGSHGNVDFSPERAYRWTTTGGFQDLGVLPGAAGSRGLGVSGDGSIVVGFCYYQGGSERAFLWTSSLGMLDVLDVLAAQGTDVSGWTLTEATAISPDGSAVVGTGYCSDGAGGLFRNWLVRDLVIPPWTNLGGGLAGESGIPALAGAGTLVAGSPGSLTLANARPFAPGALFISLGSTPVPFKGGVLIPSPVALMLAIGTDSTGGCSLAWNHWPSGLPQGSPFYFQYAIQDAAALHGVALSNGIVGLTP